MNHSLTNRNGVSGRYSADDEELKLLFTYAIMYCFLNHAVFLLFVSVILVVSIL